MTEPDQLLVERLRNGDQDALVQFIQGNQPALLAFIHKRVGKHLLKKIEPDDILQEVSVEALRAFDKVEIGDREPLNWLFHISERKIIDAHRRFFSSQKRDASREAAIGAEGSQAVPAWRICWRRV